VQELPTQYKSEAVVLQTVAVTEAGRVFQVLVYQQLLPTVVVRVKDCLVVQVAREAEAVRDRILVPVVPGLKVIRVVPVMVAMVFLDPAPGVEVAVL
jgi:hypothetical protein